MSESILKPCPFCGGTAHVMYVSDFRISSPRTGYRAVCNRCYVAKGAFSTAQDAAGDWNRRSAPPALQQQEVPREPVADFDTWQQHPYTKVLMNSIRDDYMPRADAEALIRAAASPSAPQGAPS